MPELPVKDRLADLHLSEITRDDLIRALSEIRMPDMDLSKLERPSVDLSSDAVSKAVAGAGKAVSKAAGKAHIGRRRNRRPRWALAIGGVVVAGLAAWAILTNDAIRARISETVDAIRDRLPGMGGSDADAFDAEAEDAPGVDAIDTVLPGSASNDAIGTLEPTDDPDALDADRSNGNPAFEEAGVRD